MKILQINAVNKIASTGRTTSEMAAFLRNAGHSCVVAYSVGPQENSAWEYQIGSKTDAKMHGLLSRVSGKQGYFSKGATRKLLDFTDRFAPDIVVLRNLHANYIHLPMLLQYLAKKDIATVAVLHDCWFYTGKCCHYTVAGCYKWQESCGNCPALKKYNKSWFFDKTAEMLEDKKRLFGAIPRLAVVGVSDWLTNEAKKSPVFRSAEEIERIYNWVNTETFSPREPAALRQQLDLQDKKVVLSVASSWTNEKGLDSVLQLAGRLQEKQKLLLVGHIPEGVDLPDNVLHIPQTNNLEELVSYYSMADVLFQPSLEETFGKVSAEALSCGTPVVCFRSTANPELVGENCGAVVPVGDMACLTEQITRIFETGKDFYKDRCRKFALENFDLQQNMEQYLRLFERLIQK